MEPINKDAIYIRIEHGYQGKPTLVDVHDIKDIQYIGDAIKPEDNFNNYYDEQHPPHIVKVYNIIFNDDDVWQTYLEDEVLERYNEIKKETKNKVDNTNVDSNTNNKN